MGFVCECFELWDLAVELKRKVFNKKNVAKRKLKMNNNKVEELRRECEELHKKYLELNPRDTVFAGNFEGVRDKERGWRESGQMIVDFYSTFVSKYSCETGEIFGYADDKLHCLAHLATMAISEENYFGLNVLLLPWGSRKGEPDKLEVLIEKLRLAEADE